MTFDPEDIERLEAERPWSKRELTFLNGGYDVVLASDYDKLLELYNNLRKEAPGVFVSIRED